MISPKVLAVWKYASCPQAINFTDCWLFPIVKINESDRIYGVVFEEGSTVTSINIKILSFLAINTLFWLFPETPSIFILKFADEIPFKLISEFKSKLLLLYIVSVLVILPIDAKTVSKVMVSDEKFNCAFKFISSSGFVQLKKIHALKRDINKYFIFI